MLKNRSLPNTSSFMDKLENQEELYHSTLQPPLLCIDVYKSRNKVDSSYMVREFVAYKWFDQIIHMYDLSIYMHELCAQICIPKK